MGLPLHPLIIHAVVVLVPLSALGVIFLLVFPRFAPTFSPLILILLIASTVAGFIAENSGQSLSNRVGYPGDHAEQGEQAADHAPGSSEKAMTRGTIRARSRPSKLID